MSEPFFSHRPEEDPWKVLRDIAREEDLKRELLEQADLTKEKAGVSYGQEND